MELVEVGVWLSKPFGASRKYERFRPWESVERNMETVDFKELYLGALYCCPGKSRT